MASPSETIRNPIEWARDQVGDAARYARDAGRAVAGEAEPVALGPPRVRSIGFDDLWASLRDGMRDLGATRTDVIFLCLFYPVAGVVLAGLLLDQELIPLIFPLVSGFALIGPVAAVGLYAMSRRLEHGERASWADAFATLRSPAFGAIFVLGLILLVIFAAWIGVAELIYLRTMGPAAPASLADFARDVVTTNAGWTMVVVGIAVGALFAAFVLTISVVSFPLLLDRDVGLVTAVTTSITAVRTNPRPMLLWGLVVAGSLVVGMVPLFLGLAIVLPLLGHATWHLYRRVVA